MYCKFHSYYTQSIHFIYHLITRIPFPMLTTSGVARPRPDFSCSSGSSCSRPVLACWAVSISAMHGTVQLSIGCWTQRPHLTGHWCVPSCANSLHSRKACSGSSCSSCSSFILHFGKSHVRSGKWKVKSEETARTARTARTATPQNRSADSKLVWRRATG